MNLIRFLCFFTTIVAIAKSSAEADDGSLLTKAKRIFDSKHLLRGSGLNSKRMLEAGTTKRLLQLIEINFDSINITIGSININLGWNDDNVFNNDDNECNNDCECSNPPMNEIVKFVASDGERLDRFGQSCSISDDIVVIGAWTVDNDDDSKGAAYLFHLNGTEVAKLKPNEGNKTNYFGCSVSIDEKIVVGSYEDYVEVFSHDGIYERTLTCEGCYWFGRSVATLGNLIVTYGRQNSIWKVFIYGTDGELLKTLEQERKIEDVAMSEKYIVSTASKTIIYSNTSPDFPEVAEIKRKGRAVAVAGERLLIGNFYANDYDGVAYLYKTDGTLVTALDRRDASSEWASFGGSVAITDDKVFAKAKVDDQGKDIRSIFIYSAETGNFIQKAVVSDGKPEDSFGSSVCTSDSYFVVGASGDNDNGNDSGAAYLFQLSE